MKSFFSAFSDSAKEFKNLKSMILTSLFIALHVVLAMYLSIFVTNSLRISISFIANVITSALFGPVIGLVAGAIADVIQLFMNPVGGGYFPGWTLNAALSGLVYGIFFYKKFPRTLHSCDDEHNEERHKIFDRVIYIMALVLPLITAALWAFAPFLTKGDLSGSGLDLIKEGGSLAIISGIMITVCALILILSIFNQHTIPMAVTIICGFAVVLAVYTDKKTVSVSWGFIAIVVLLVIYILSQIAFMISKHTVDTRYMIRCFIAMTIVAILINSVLGTYWLSIMYGKGFEVYFISRLIKNLIQLPINVILTYYVLSFVKGLRKQI
ncbi:MAG: folate family ECF transporter S component [Lachnospira sp.]|nr:folate family ECF transporter S component [Lachnospira sp.]